MMTSKKLTPALLMSAAAFAVTAAVAQAAPTPPKAKISPAQAKASAVKKIPGRATAAKYEFEDGHWQYAVTVVPSWRHSGLRGRRRTRTSPARA